MKTNELQIDEHRLDKECLNQPELYRMYSKKAAKSKLAFDQAKAKLDYTEARLSLRIRKHGEKTTESCIRDQIKTMQEYRDCVEEVNQARYKMELYSGLVTTCEHRKRSLTLLVELRTQNYYSDVRVNPSARKSFTDEEKRKIRN